MKKTIILLLTASLAVMGFAVNDQIEDINAIKKSKDYLYGEATTTTIGKADTLAFEMLEEEVRRWAAQQGDTLKLHIDGRKLRLLADTILTRRASMFRVFAYVRKSDLTPSQHPSQRLTLPSKDSLVNDSVKSTIMKHFFKKKKSTGSALYRIKQARNFFELKDIMQPLKEEGQIIDYGKYATAEHPEDCYLIVYDPAGNIKALLGKGKQTRPNLKTNKADTLDNYRGCGAIWFTLREN